MTAVPALTVQERIDQLVLDARAARDDRHSLLGIARQTELAGLDLQPILIRYVDRHGWNVEAVMAQAALKALSHHVQRVLLDPGSLDTSELRGQVQHAVCRAVDAGTLLAG